ncbi:MAG: HAMP domain-containing histidine kinase [Clostridia bacterium]|nr:HAMP domain-containing histidine kinase [Clostridia bacterium]
MKNKIAKRLTLYFISVLLVFALIAGSLFSLMFARHTADVTAKDMREHAESIAATLSHFIANYVQGECQGGGFKSYTRFIADAATGDLFLFDQNYGPVTLGEMALPDTDLPEGAAALIDRVYEENDVISESFSTSLFHADNLIAGAPIHDKDGNVLYALLLCSPAGSIDHAQQDTVYILAACLSIAGILGVIVSDILSHRFVTPLNRMMDTTTQLTQGNYDAKTNVRQNDEIGTLARHIDTLAQELAAAEKERSQLEQMRQDFFSDISHELRTPIAVLKGNAELLQSGIITEPAKLQSAYDQLSADATHIQHLVNDLLELTRLQNPHFTIDMAVINLPDVLSDTVRSMRQAAQKKQITLQLESPVSLYPVLGDYGRLRQLMIVLLDNAIKFSPEQSVIRIIVTPDGERCAVSVVDQGTGIEPQALEHIFDRYFHSRSRHNAGGSGLGLPIAKEIALRHNLDFTCTSEVGKGTCFTLVFVRQEPQEE